MADLPALFAAPMVRSLIADTKQQTRRLAPVPRFEPDGCRNANMGGRNNWFDYWAADRAEVHRFKTNYAVGDRLYVREAWRSRADLNRIPPREMMSGVAVWYEADGKGPYTDLHMPGKFRQGMHMPKWASRITLIVEGVKVERLQDITRDDAIAEGLTRMPLAPPLAIAHGCDWGFDGDTRHGSPVSAYAALWDHINGDGAWATNPWVVAYTFRRIMGNIDDIREAA